MVSCTYPWTNRDVFDNHPTCSVYQPLYLFFCSILFILSAICFLWGLHQLRKQTRWDLPLAGTILGFLFTLSYGITLGTKWTLGDRHIGLNFIHGMARGSIWVGINLRSFRHLEVITAVDTQTVSRSRQFYDFVMKFNLLVCILSAIVEILGIMIPTFVLSVDFYMTLQLSSLVLMFLNTIPRIMYSNYLQKIILSLQPPGSKDLSAFYVPILKQLRSVVIGTVLATIISGTLIFCSIYIPILRNNLYIFYSIQIAGGPSVGLGGLYQNRKITNSKSNTQGEEEAGASMKSTQKASEHHLPQHHTDEEQGSPLSPSSEAFPLVVPESPPTPNEGVEEKNSLEIVELRKGESGELDVSGETGISSSSGKNPSSSDVPIWNPFTKSTQS